MKGNKGARKVGGGRGAGGGASRNRRAVRGTNERANKIVRL